MSVTPPIPLSKYTGKIWIDGHLAEWNTAQIHVLTHSLHYASSVFEGERAYNGQIFALEKHSERLKKSANLLGFEIPWSIQEITKASQRVVEENGLKNAYIRPISWHGSEELDISCLKNTIHLAIAAWEWPNPTSSTGARLSIGKWRRPHPKTMPTQAKAAGLYTVSMIEKNLAEHAGFDDSLLLDWQGYVAEACGANLFFVFKNELHTPIPDCFLNGITRQTVIELAKRNGLRIVERKIDPREIKDADEIFKTGTAVEVKPVVQVGDHHFPIGPITSMMETQYQEEVHRHL